MRRFISEESRLEKIPVVAPAQVYRMMKPVMKGLETEECWVIYLNSARYVIGTEELISAKNQGDKAGADYVYSSDEDLVLTGRIAEKNLKMTKVSMIAQQIGQCPVLSFGNSAGDISMTNLVMGNEWYKTAAFFVCCDDTERENGDLEKAQKVRNFCAENGWIPISMKDDWKTIYGAGVTRKHGK